LWRCQIEFELAKSDEEIEQLQTAEVHLINAIMFDDESVYSEQLNHCLKRLQLRAELYVTPDRIEDKCAMIIEQCVIGGKKNRKSGVQLKPSIEEMFKSLNNETKNTTPLTNEINTHSLLLKAADMLAPREFMHVLESEKFNATFGKLNEDPVSVLARKVVNYESCIDKCKNHLTDRLNDIERDFKRSFTTTSSNNRVNSSSSSSSSNKKGELESALANDFKERLKLWIDLASIARKEQIWDISRVSGRFCLLYDDEKLLKRFLTIPTDDKDSMNSLFDKDLMRDIAKAHCIIGEVT
jgi:hypothetical protein